MAKKSDIKGKKDKVLGKQKKPNYLLFGFIGAVVVIAGAIVLFNGNKSSAPAGSDVTNVGSQSYSGQKIEMTDLKADASNGKLAINLSDIKNDKIVRFEDPNATLKLNSGDTVPLPLVAYVSTKGDVKVAIADCEPCSSTRFHIEGDKLVCNACGTEWNLDDLQGISGGCTQYPPDQKAYKVNGSKLTIDQSAIQDWKPRA